MSAIAELEQRVEAARHTLCLIEQQHSKSSEDLTGLLEEVAESVNRNRAELTENQVQYERIIDEFAQLQDLLHSPVLSLEASRRRCLDDIFRDLDAEVVDLESAKPVNGELANHAAGQVENFAVADPDRVRLGLQRALKKSRNHVAEAQEAAT